ncbi:MAG: hypothetical protein FJ098_10950, partial [Deltaproteobacteria bacterium]|nr:hypothetical protein [Deltaproteobacteria bacterium]
PLPRLAPEGSPSDALPGLEGWPPGEEPWADLSLVAENPALAPGTMLFLRIAVRDGLGRPCAAGLTVTARSEGAAAPFLQRGDLATGEDGFLDVEIPMPAEEDFGRVDVVAAAPDHLVAESSLRIWVRAPVELHPLLPGFLRAGDQVRVAALARSRAPGPVSALFRVRSAGAGALSDPVPVTLEPGVTRIVEAPAEATVVGEAVFQLALAAPGPDAGLAHQEVRVPVLRPGPLLRGAALGAVEGAVGIPVQRPGGFLAGSGRLEVEFTADPRIALEEPLRDLLTDSTGSAEVLAGRIRVLAALYRDPGVFPRGGVEDPAEARARLAEDLSRLLSGQREDGGFGPWPDARGSEPVASARVAEALRAARDVLDGGEAPGVGREALDMALDGVLRFLAAAVDGEQGGATERGDPAARALVLRSLALSGVPAPRAADGLYAELRDPDGPGSPQARAWLLEALHAADPEDVRVEELVAALRGAAVEGSGGAVIPDPGQVIPGRPVDLAGAAVVHALLSTRPGDTMIPRLAAGLLSGTVGGRWSGSEAGAWALQALALYYRGLERPRQELEARAWVADRMILGERFRRLEDRGRISLPLEELPGTGPMTVRVGVRGTSRIFWRVALEGVEAAVFRLGEDRGIRVERELTRVMGGPAPLRTDAGQWTLPLGAFVRERLRIVVSGPRRRVWVDAPLPAGLVPAEEAGAVMAPGTWDHVDAGPEGTRLARETLPPGVYEHSRLLRAVSPGDFVYPAARAWCLSEPGVSGRGPSERLVVTAPVPRVD